ncbi:MAG: sensor domain-containing diguanylate cyclase [Saccharospirillum sp.]
MMDRIASTLHPAARMAALRLGIVATVGLAYYVSARFGITQTITREGIAVVWPPNAILLSALLLSAPKHWPYILLAGFVAEITASLTSFPLWATLCFGGINLFESALAASLIRRGLQQPFDFTQLRMASRFLLFGPLLAAATAAVLGAAVYYYLGRADSTFFALWRLWWFGDALGLLLLTPLLVRLGREAETRFTGPGWRPSKLAELAALWAAVMVLGSWVFISVDHTAEAFHLTPAMMIPLGLLAAFRFGVLGAAATALMIAILAVSYLIHGPHPYAEATPHFAVWQMQEYLSIVAILSVGLAILLHENRQQRKTLQLQYRAMLDSNDAIAIADASKQDLPLVWINPKFESLFGYRAEEVIGRNCRFLQGDSKDQMAIAEIRTALEEHRTCSVTLRNYTKDGVPLWIQLSLAPVHNRSGHVTHYVGIQHDLTEEKAQEDALQKARQVLEKQNELLESKVLERTHSLQTSNEALQAANKKLMTLASQDYLTGIANRRHFFETARRELKRQRREQNDVALIIFDLDHFKEINDRYGHEGGDEVLRSIIPPTKASIRPMDLFGRIGGEEFLILLPGINEQIAADIAERIRHSIQALRIPCKNQTIRVTASFGVSGWDGISDLETLIFWGDSALYKAKQSGRNCVYQFPNAPQPKKQVE